MFAFRKIDYKRIIAHIVYWIIFVLSYPVFYSAITIGNLNLYPIQVENVFFGCWYLIIAAYFISYYLVPKFLIINKRVFLFIVFYILVFIVITCIDLLLTRYTVFPKYYPQYIDQFSELILSLKNISKTFFILHSQVFIFIAVRFFIHYIRGYSEKESLRFKMAETELNMLKGQIHPHFLFNTLNNIYTMSLDCNNLEMSESVAKMSDILRFTLYECNTENISLNKELKIIQDYIDLEKLRYSELDIQVLVPANIPDLQIVPLILFTFVENAFKHGASKTIHDKWIKIDIFFENNNFHFNVRNSKSPKKRPEKDSKGLGIENAVKRLDLAYGKGNHKLDINNGDTFFEVNLSIFKLKNQE